LAKVKGFELKERFFDGNGKKKNPPPKATNTAHGGGVQRSETSYSRFLDCYFDVG
jgi:hypothetical protein